MSTFTAPADPAGAPLPPAFRRIFLTALLLPAEILLVSLLFDAQPLLANADGGLVSTLLGHAAAVIRGATVFAALWLLLTAPALLQDLRSLAVRSHRPGLHLAAAHLGSLVALLAASSRLFPDTGAAGASPAVVLAAAWLLAGLGVLATWAGMLAPASWWGAVLGRDRRRLPAAAGAAVLVTVLAEWTDTFWDGLSAATLATARALLELVYDDVVVDPGTRLLGLGDFVVTVGAQCSGLEGMLLTAIVTGTYLYAFRREFRFPAALVLLPAGMILIWCFNALRIALLVAIGAAGYPDLALGGFHSQAGWISFIVVSVTILHAAHRLGFAGADRPRPARRALTPAAAMLVPLLVVLATGLVTAAATSVVDWLYPLRVLTGALALAWCWRHLGMPRPAWQPRPLLGAVLIGAAVAALWILTTAPDPARDAAVAAAWGEQTAAVAWGWLGLRVLGAVALVPVVEELAFRGYLLARLDRSAPVLDRPLVTGWMPLLVSAAVFGVLHDAWVAGGLAGLAFGLMRRHGGIWPVIGAHATANALLAVYVGVTGFWSVW